MDTRVAIISIIVENPESTARLNDILHQHAEYVIGRLGLPYRARGIGIICVVVDAPQNVVSALSGKLGMVPDVSIKTVYSKQGGGNEPAEE